MAEYADELIDDALSPAWANCTGATSAGSPLRTSLHIRKTDAATSCRISYVTN